MNSENSERNDTLDDYQMGVQTQTQNYYSQKDPMKHQSAQNIQGVERIAGSQNDYNLNNFGVNNINKNQTNGSNSWFFNNNSMQEEDSKDEDEQNDTSSYAANQTYSSNNCLGNDANIDQENYLNAHLNRQYQTQNVNRKYLQRQNIFENPKEKQANLFSSSFDESAPQLELKPQRNCKSSTRMLNKTQIKQGYNTQTPVPPLMHNVSTGSGVLTAGSLNRSQGVFNNYIKNKQMQNSYQQAILNQLQRANTQNSFDMKNFQDLSNRSITQTPGNMMSNSFVINQYFGQTMNTQSSNKPITPHNISMSGQSQMQQIIMSAGSQMNPRNSQVNSNSTMDPYAYLRQKQQKYKSCRSNQANNGVNAQIYKQNTHIIANSAYLLQQKKGNQTQKTNLINKSRCSSNGSALGNASMTTTITGIKSLSEVKNPSMFISWRFCDKKLTDLKDIGQFKNLTDLDISGNLLQTEVVELKQLQFLKKLNLSNNQISEIYPLPHNLEYLNLSSNQIKCVNSEVSIHLKNLTTLDITNNQVDNIEGIQHMKRLKRLIAKNNQIQSLDLLKDITTIIEIDLENNPIEDIKELFSGIAFKKDILVLNLKMTPLFLMIQNYEQIINELSDKIEQSQIDWFKLKLRFFNNGSLYRTKRVFIKIKSQLQHSKRSSSNFSNGSSSCGRQGTNTGGRGGNTSGSNKINTSAIHAFSPLLNNTVTTPNYQFATQRQEDFEQLYDEILDEEEDHERKQSKLQKRKLKKEGHLVQDDSQDEDEDESFYEDEEYNNPSMSCDEDLDELQSYRNQAALHQHHDILNESTADFNKEIKQINQELREQLGAEFLNDCSMGGNPDHARSLHSTQSVSTNKKNPISFKLDLSKCTQQQSEEEDYDNKGSNDQENDDQFDIPGLNFVKVTDDSFRQLQKQQSQQQSLRQKLEKIPSEQIQNETQKNTLRDYNPKPQQTKQMIVIPKLPLGQLQSMSTLHQIPIKESINQSLNLNNSKKSLCSIKTFKNEEDEQSNRVVKVQKNIHSECKNSVCLKLKEELKALKQEHESNLGSLKSENIELKQVIENIKTQISCQQNDIKQLPNNLKTFISTMKQENTKVQISMNMLQIKLDNLKSYVSTQNPGEKEALELKYQQSLKTIEDLQEQLKAKDKEQSSRQLSQEFSLNLKQLNLNADFKRTQSTNYDNINLNLIQSAQNFYQTDKSNSKVISARRDSQNDVSAAIIENLNNYSRKKFTCDIKKVKRPQSVVGHRKSSYCIKINSLLRIENPNLNASNIDESQYTNEYGSTTQDYLKNQDQVQPGQTINKRVGHYIERLKERNSSLQERLNGSFGSSTQNPKSGVSPLNIQKLNLNLTNQQDLQFSNPYIISPANEDSSLPNLTAQSSSNMGSNNQRVSVFTLHAQNQRQTSSKENTVIRKISNIDSSSSINDLSGREYQISSNQLPSQNYSNHSKTQRLNVKKIQYNQFFINNVNQVTQQNRQEANLSSQNIQSQQIPLKEPNVYPSAEYQLSSYNTSSNNLTQKANMVSGGSSTSVNQQQTSKPNFGQLKIQNVNQTFDGSLNFYPPKKSERAIISSKTYLTNQSFRESQIQQQQNSNANQTSSYSSSNTSQQLPQSSNNLLNLKLSSNSIDQRSARKN
eukprot:403347996